jgi:hypothetical protein
MIRLEYGDERGITGRIDFLSNQPLVDWMFTHLDLFIDEIALLLRNREYNDTSTGNLSWYKLKEVSQ